MKTLVLLVAVCLAALTGYHLDLTCCGEGARRDELPPATKATPPAPELSKTKDRVETTRDALVQQTPR
jgi:hypothetical protein